MTTNHQANGPVSLERLHQIRETLSKAAAQSDGGNLGYAMADAVKVIDGVIASFGAEPVGTFRKGPCGYYPSFHEDAVPLYTVPPAPVSVPAAMEMDDDFDSAFEHGKAVGWNAYRAAMLQAEPVSNRDELPLDYLQGHKDGLEWAAQLAEANHPQTGDWLYDDPIDLARAIRKGPDMPTVQGGNSPVTPDAWISCSDRMPEKNQNVLISANFDSSLVEPLICSARYTGSTFRRGDATIKPGNGIEQATHWMPLPEPPQEVNRG